MKQFTHYILLAAVALLYSACDKVSPIGVLVSGTGVEDRVKMSYQYYMEHKGELKVQDASDMDEYTFLVGADSHLTTDDGRMREMLQIGMNNNDLLYAHLGDIADTKAEYYVTLEELIDEYRWKYAKKHYKEFFWGDPEIPFQVNDPSRYTYIDTLTNDAYGVDDIPFPFYPVVGNHDIRQSRHHPQWMGAMVKHIPLVVLRCVCVGGGRTFVVRSLYLPRFG